LRDMFALLNPGGVAESLPLFWETCLLCWTLAL